MMGEGDWREITSDLLQRAKNQKKEVSLIMDKKFGGGDIKNRRDTREKKNMGIATVKCKRRGQEELA